MGAFGHGNPRRRSGYPALWRSLLRDEAGDIIWSIGARARRRFSGLPPSAILALALFSHSEGGDCAADAFELDGRALAIICGYHAGGNVKREHRRHNGDLYQEEALDSPEPGSFNASEAHLPVQVLSSSMA